MIIEDKSGHVESVATGNGNDGTDVKKLLNPLSNHRRRRDTPVGSSDKTTQEQIEVEDETPFPDAQGVSHFEICTF